MRACGYFACAMLVALVFALALGGVGCKDAPPPASDAIVATSDALVRAELRNDGIIDESRRVITHAAGAVKDSGYRIEATATLQRHDLTDARAALEKTQVNAASLYHDVVVAREEARAAKQQIAFDRSLWWSYKQRQTAKWLIGGSLALLIVLGLLTDFLPAGIFRKAAAKLFGLLFSGIKGAFCLCVVGPIDALRNIAKKKSSPNDQPPPGSLPAD